MEALELEDVRKCQRQIQQRTYLVFHCLQGLRDIVDFRLGCNTNTCLLRLFPFSELGKKFNLFFI